MGIKVRRQKWAVVLHSVDSSLKLVKIKLNVQQAHRVSNNRFCPPLVLHRQEFVDAILGDRARIMIGDRSLATILGRKRINRLEPGVWEPTLRLGNRGHKERRRLVSLPKVPGFQEPLYGHHSIQPSETSHAVGYVETDEGTSLGDLATAPAAASVLLGIVLVFLGALCLKRFRKGERRQERTSYDDNG